jgi:hypothetical protein
VADSATGGDGADLIGDIGSDGAGEASSPNGALDAVNAGVDEASTQEDKEKQREKERKLVKALQAEYEAARDFDKPARMTYASDRKYAAGLSDPSWASDANLIGSFIDIMTSFLYAQNPDVSCKPAEKVKPLQDPNAPPQQQQQSANDQDAQAFAQTMELMISKLWHLAKMKRGVRRQVRSVLSIGIGWSKGLMWSRKRPQPQVEKALYDAEQQTMALQAAVAELKDTNSDPNDLVLQQEKITNLIGDLRSKLLKNTEAGLNYDFVRAEDMQVSLDVSNVMDYRDADWMSEDIYIPRTALRTRFPVLEEEDVQRAIVYYQKNIPANAKGDVLQAATGEEAADGNYSKTAPSLVMSGAKPTEFAKVVEFWDRRDGHVKTFVDGMDRWAVEPYIPPQASNRFYPYFGLAFFEVDGHRHPQSLSWRLRKLQDEYAACRSNQRLTRERSIPGLIFNSGLMSPEDAKKLEVSVIAEMVGLKLTDINMPIQNAVMVKPLPTIDVRLWDTSVIRQDMESLSGVQEALQQTVSQQPKTATEAQIQQTGFASRTSADRDSLEDMLTDLAEYTAETAIQEIPGPVAQRIAGGNAFWPYGMDVQDVLTMVDVDITAGTTGKPNLAADKANWATILPLLQKLIVQIRQVQPSDPPLAQALENLLRESLHRMDDRLDIDEFIPTTPPPPQPPPPPPPPAVSVSLKGELPPLDAAAIGAKAAGLPPEAVLATGGAPPTAMAHAGLAPPDGELPPPHPGMPEPLPEPKAAPHTQGKMA